MNRILNAGKDIFKSLKHNVWLRTVLVSALVLILIVSATLAWYIDNQRLLGIQFETGNIGFDAYVYDSEGNRLLGPVSSNDKDETAYTNSPLITIKNAQKGTTGTAYIVVKSTGTIGIQYRIAFGIDGLNEKSIAYLGGYKYTVSRVTDTAEFDVDQSAFMDVSDCPVPEKINNEIVTIDKNAVNGTIQEEDGYDVYRIDYTLVEKNEEYTGGGIKIYFNIFATQIGGDFEDTEERGHTYYCSTREDIDRAKVEAYPGDIIKLSSDIIYYGDLVFNKPVNLETNNFTLTVNGNLMYDYVLGNSLRLDAGGLGKIVVQSTKEGIGGNFQIKAPLSEVSLIGANSSNGDIVVENKIIIDATNSFGSSGVSFNEVRIVDLKNSRKTIQLESNTRATVSFGTTIGIFQSVVKANNIEIVNNGELGEINLSNMELLAKNNSPQIYILNNNDINNPIKLPEWSEKFYEDESGTCFGNTRIIQSFSGSVTEVEGDCVFTNFDVEVEKKDLLVEQIVEGDDSRLRIYYQDVDSQTTTIRSILEGYLNGSSETSVNEIVQLEIISVGSKALTKSDIQFMNSNEMLALKHLDMQRANVYDASSDTYHKLPSGTFRDVSKYESLVLPQNLVEIGDDAFRNSAVSSIITVPSNVTAFGSNWFNNGKYVHFAASVPVVQASNGMANVKAVFVEEAYISSYKSVYSNYSNKIYPASVLDETKQHFIRNIKDDEWEITYYISGDEPVIGENISLDGTLLKITSVYDNAYRHNYTGSSVKFADSVVNLGAGNFSDNKTIKEVDLNKLKNVGNSAFSGASALEKISFGETLETIGSSAFENCASLTQDIVLPNTMQRIGMSAFRRTRISSVNTGGTVSVDGYAFAECSAMIYAELPNVEYVGEDGTDRLFTYCSSLVSVQMPAFVKASGQRMFAGCTSLRELYMNANSDDFALGSTPFATCNMAKLKVYVPEEYLGFYQTKLKGAIESSMIYPQGEKMGEELVNGFNIGKYIVSDNGNNTYTLITSNIDYTDSFVIPETYNGKAITDIYANAFRNQNFTNVTLKLGNSIHSIGSNAFYQLSGLVSVDFGNSLEEIGSSAFASCKNLSQNIVLPDSMKSIESHAFSDSGILSINTGGTTSIEARAFAECKSLVFVKMPEVIVIAENGTNVLFYNSTALVSVDMPKVAKVNGSNMFQYCSSLAEIYLGSNDAAISLGTSPFKEIDSTKIKLFVPEELVSLYQGRKIVDASQVYPCGEKIGDKSVNGFIIGDYVVLDNGNGYTLITSNLNFEGDVVVPNEYNGKPITGIYTNAFRMQSFEDARLVLGDNIKVIGNNAFYGTAGLKSIVMNQVATIGSGAFNGSGIQTLNAPKLISVGNDAFRNCASLEIVSVPKLETIEGSYVFAGCTNLKSVYFENIKSLHNDTFNADKNLEKITVNRLIGNGDSLPAEISLDASAPCKIYVPYRSLAAWPSIWSGKPVVSFDISATNNGNTYILSDNNGRYALIDFVPGQTITSLMLPATVYASELGDIPIYSINTDAFSSLAATLKSLTLSSTVALMEGTALSECIALENIYVSSDNMYFTSVNGVLYSKDSKMLVKYPVGRSGNFDMTGADYAYTVGISANAFANAAKLTQIVFPESLMVIDSTAFVGCTQLSTVEFTGNTPPVLMGSGIFDTAVEDFEMVIPTTDGDVVTTYLCAYNFGEYEPYIDLNGHAAPDANTPRNQVPLGNNQPAMITTYEMPNFGKTEEDDDDSSEDDETDGE